MHSDTGLLHEPMEDGNMTSLGLNQEVEAEREDEIGHHYKREKDGGDPDHMIVVIPVKRGHDRKAFRLRLTGDHHITIGRIGGRETMSQEKGGYLLMRTRTCHH